MADFKFINTDENGYPVPTIHDDLPETVYHSSPGISKHGLDLINQSGLHYKEQRHEETKALIYGGAFHCLVLEPHKFNDGYIVNTEHKDFRTKIAKTWRDEQQAEGKRVLSLAEYNHMLEMEKVIRDHPVASILLDPNQGKAEQSFYWIDPITKKLCRCRTDFVNYAHAEDLVIDLKTTECAGFSKFMKQIREYRYHVQAAFYMDGLRHCGVKPKRFIFVAIEKKPPYGIACYSIKRRPADDDNHKTKEYRSYDLGREIYERDLAKFAEYHNADCWPGYEIDVRDVDLPKYADYQDFY